MVHVRKERERKCIESHTDVCNVDVSHTQCRTVEHTGCPERKRGPLLTVHSLLSFLSCAPASRFPPPALWLLRSFTRHTHTRCLHGTTCTTCLHGMVASCEGVQCGAGKRCKSEEGRSPRCVCDPVCSRKKRKLGPVCGEPLFLLPFFFLHSTARLSPTSRSDTTSCPEHTVCDSLCLACRCSRTRTSPPRLSLRTVCLLSDPDSIHTRTLFIRSPVHPVLDRNRRQDLPTRLSIDEKEVHERGSAPVCRVSRSMQR